MFFSHSSPYQGILSQALIFSAAIYDILSRYYELGLIYQELVMILFLTL